MPYTKISLTNAALIEIGRRSVTSMTESTEEARVANLIFDGLLDEEVSRYPWTFATVRTELDTPEATDPEFGWVNQFALPDDCLRVLDEINDVDYRIEGRMILSDEDTLQIRYIARPLFGYEAVADLNGGFEYYSEGSLVAWVASPSAGGALIETSLHERSGVNCIGCQNVSDGDSHYYQNIVVTPGGLGILTFWTKGDGSKAGRYSIYDVTHSADIVAATSTGVTAATYAQVTASFQVPAGCSQIRIRLQAPSTAGIAYFDDVALQTGTDSYANLSPAFAKLFQFRLASKLAVALRGSGELRDRMDKEYRDARDHAESLDAGQEPVGEQEQGSWLDARGGI
jgi:hypothetical protein